MKQIIKNNKGQALAPQSIHMDETVFENSSTTDIYWLGSAGIMIHSRDTNIITK